MPRRPAPFTQADVVRAFKAGQAAGKKVAIELVAPSGHTMRIVEHSPAERSQTPFDEWKANRNAR